MNLKIRNVILLVVHTIAFALLFFPYMYYHCSWVRSINGDYFFLKEPFAFSDLINRIQYSEWSEPFAIVILILFFAVYIALLLQLIGKSESQQNGMIVLLISIINLFAFFWYFYFLTKIMWSERNVFELGEVFYVELLLQVALVVFFVLTYAKNRFENANSQIS